jgi:ATP-dependent protease HslVU (ClpYQ) peptidase subunit
MCRDAPNNSTLGNIIMKRCLFLTAFLVGITSAASSRATSCDKTIFDIINRDLKFSENRVAAESCRPWPYKHNIILSAVAFAADSNDHQEEQNKKLLVVAVIDRTTNRVISSYRSVISEDAITAVGEGSLHLDPARYQLAPNVRAFGLRFTSLAIGASCGEANWNNELTLYVPDGKRLRPVLNLYMYQQKSISGCLSNFSENAVWENADLTISVEKTTTNGFADLLVTAMISPDSNGTNDGNMRQRVETSLLRYDGRVYTKGKYAPWWLGF